MAICWKCKRMGCRTDGCYNRGYGITGDCLHCGAPDAIDMIIDDELGCGGWITYMGGCLLIISVSVLQAFTWQYGQPLLAGLILGLFWAAATYGVFGKNSYKTWVKTTALTTMLAITIFEIVTCYYPLSSTAVQRIRH